MKSGNPTSMDKAKNLKVIRRNIDICMTGLMLCLMAYQVTGESAHEWIGIGMSLLIILHQIVNRKWYIAIIKGKYSLLRAWILCVDILLLGSFAITAICGISMSIYATPFLYGLLPIVFARVTHLAMSHWAFILAGLHVGIHVPSMISGRKLRGGTRIVLFAVFTLSAAAGLFVFIKSGIVRYLTFKTHFAFLDYDKAGALVFLENILMLLFWVFIGTLIFQSLKGNKRRSG